MIISEVLMWAWPHTNSVSRAQGHHHNAALALFLTLNIMGHVLCTHTEVLEKKHKKERVRPAVSSGTQREALAAAGVCVSVKPAELSSLLAAEELMRLGGDCVFHLGLTAKAGMSSARTACLSLLSCGQQPPHTR